MLPRSERTSIYIVIAVCLVAIVAGIIGLAQAISGDAKAPPAYESRPSPKVAPVTGASLVDIESASRPPISDSEFELFHRVARISTPLMLSGGWRKALAPYVASSSVLSQAQTAVDSYTPYVKGKAISGARAIDVRRPTTVVIQRPGKSPEKLLRSGTTASALISGKSLDGTALASSRLVVQFTWERRAGGEWRITSIEPQYQAAEDPSGGSEPQGIVGG
jgi:hypothetical protein